MSLTVNPKRPVPRSVRLPNRAIIIAAHAEGTDARGGAHLPSLAEIDGRPLIDWQIDALEANGIRQCVVVAGAESERLERHLKSRTQVRILHNPFHRVSGTLASLWVARQEMPRSFLALDGHALASPASIRSLLVNGRSDINVMTVPDGGALSQRQWFAESPCLFSFLGNGMEIRRKLDEAMMKQGGPEAGLSAFIRSLHHGRLTFPETKPAMLREMMASQAAQDYAEAA